MRILATDPATPAPVKKRVQSLFLGWSKELKGHRGYERLAALYKELPQRARKVRPQPKYLSNDPHELDDDEETHAEAESRTTSPTPGISGRQSRRNSGSGIPVVAASGSGRGNTTNAEAAPAFMFGHAHAEPQTSYMFGKKKGKHSKTSSRSAAPVPKIDIVKERPLIQQALAEATRASTNLINSLTHINWEEELSTENKQATEWFNRCRKLRKTILRYIHGVESEEFIGSLIHANEELIAALQKYDKMSTAPDDDSDSDYENDDWRVESGLRNVKLSNREDDDEDDDDDDDSDATDSQGKQKSAKHADENDDPFGDSNVIRNSVDESSYNRY